MLLSVLVDHGLHRIDIRMGKFPVLGESGHKGGQGIFKLAFDQVVDLGGLDFLLAYQGGDNGILVFQNTALGKTLDHRVGGGGLPTQLLLAQPYQLLAFYRLMLP